MKHSNYRLIVKKSNVSSYYFIEEKFKYFFGLITQWNLIEGLSFKSELEAQKYLKQLEVNRAKLMDNTLHKSVYYYDFKEDKIVEE